MRTGLSRYIFIVSLRHPALYDHLMQRFSADPNVQVILDRRRAERRQAEGSVMPELERRQADRRQRPGVSEELRRLFVAVVTIP